MAPHVPRGGVALVVVWVSLWCAAEGRLPRVKVPRVKVRQARCAPLTESATEGAANDLSDEALGDLAERAWQVAVRRRRRLAFDESRRESLPPDVRGRPTRASARTDVLGARVVGEHVSERVAAVVGAELLAVAAVARHGLRALRAAIADDDGGDVAFRAGTRLVKAPLHGVSVLD